MLRISQYLREVAAAERSGEYPRATRRIQPDGQAGAGASGPVVIWNLTRRCNLTCKHCYALSADHDYPGELSFAEVCSAMDNLKTYGVPVLILSGGEPLLRPDLFEIAARAQAQGFYTALSTNGTLIDAPMAERIAAQKFDYVGISIDGTRETHDKFRRLDGAYDASLNAIRLLHAQGVKTGLRYTFTDLNDQDFPALLQLMKDEQVDKFYFSHLNYAGRGNIHRGRDARFDATRAGLDLLFETAWADAVAGSERDYVTGNNDADAAYLLRWVEQRWPRWAPALRERLVAWGGNASGVGVANIDNLGEVHPDTMWWHYPLGNLRQRPFSAIWSDRSDPLMDGLKTKPRPVKGRCAECAHFALCGGNTRVRAQQVTGDLWAEDPGCYLDDAEIGLSADASARLSRVESSAFSYTGKNEAKKAAVVAPIIPIHDL
ncbi:heme d1 biosynthesis radical SAM protein NirJ [Paucibacter sp. TC2R-5]|uniref:heme d1 biosynthesis radical SAM protein NirJ n=1 Tax=Paucibacter sp. TC2R-5 TaxID=2893555 RepID=UPI0021E393DD|nr:heme d1 biosynthesis radical SAM protein NirJ [Paucibacter sp. TC2R-5]MCV2358853.1 heme d1 biosynthesis radical SAM protein NirJ [Paucibacter sp. TC2R-5]